MKSRFIRNKYIFQTFRSEFAIERLDEGIVSRLAGSGEVERDAALISPEVEMRDTNSVP